MHWKTELPMETRHRFTSLAASGHPTLAPSNLAFPVARGEGPGPVPCGICDVDVHRHGAPASKMALLKVEASQLGAQWTFAGAI